MAADKDAADTNYDVDLFVIGGGSGGVRAARIASGYGARVMLAEEYRLGGTCVIRGCVPKKLMVLASRFQQNFQDAAGFGWEVEPARFSWSNLIAAKDREITRLEGAYHATLQKAGVIIRESRAVLEAPNRVYLLATGERIRARIVLIATGGTPSLEPAIPGGALGITSNEVFHLPEQPARILIVGGGYIAVEFAGIFQGLGSEVTLLHRGEQVLRGFDAELGDRLSEAMEEQGIKLCLGCTIERLERQDDDIHAFTNTGQTLRADQVLVATGRRPNTSGLGLESLNIVLDKEGAVPVNEQSRTVLDWLYAVGDVTNRVNLTPAAIREGHAFADRIFGGKTAAPGYQTIPTGVFSTPEIGTVGLTEEEARTQGAVKIFKTEFRPMQAVLAGALPSSFARRTFMKLIVEGETDKVLGVHIMGDHAAELIQLAAIALEMGATKADFDKTLAVHPTAAEELVTMRVAAS
jgi:glutathione reductase (NADPH)